MLRKFLLLVSLLIFFANFAYAKEENSAEEDKTEKSLIEKPDFWIGVGFHTAFYDPSELSLGGSLSVGYGSGSSIGFMASYFLNTSYSSVLELDLLLRIYLSGKNAFLGPFLQVVGGASLINYDLAINIPSNTGIFNAGLGFGWRLIAVNKFYWEPFVRVGYPYYCCFTLTIGIRT
jgi:hypothetical protein